LEAVARGDLTVTGHPRPGTQKKKARPGGTSSRKPSKKMRRRRSRMRMKKRKKRKEALARAAAAERKRLKREAKKLKPREFTKFPSIDSRDVVDLLDALL